jgi:hypothetical protein
MREHLWKGQTQAFFVMVTSSMPNPVMTRYSLASAIVYTMMGKEIRAGWMELKMWRRKENVARLLNLCTDDECTVRLR